MAVNTALPQLRQVYARFPRVSIVGVGDEGNGVISRVFEAGGSGAQCIAVNTEREALDQAFSHHKVLMGSCTIVDPEDSDLRLHERTVRECASLMTPLLAGADVVFVAAKMKEAKATGIAPLVAAAAKNSGAITVGLAIMPIPPLKEDRLVAYRGLARMRHSCHTVAIVDAGRSVDCSEYPPNVFDESADEIVIDVVSGLAQSLACPSTLNVDLSAFRELMIHGGIAHVGIGHSSSALRVEEATIQALRGPLPYDNITRTRGALLILRGAADLGTEEAQTAGELVTERIGRNAPILIGVNTDATFAEELQVSVLLTGGMYPFIPGGYRRLPLEMYEMEPDGEDEGHLGLELDLDQLEEP